MAATRWSLDAGGLIWCASAMRRQHRTLIAVGALLFLAGWLAWSVLLTESELPEPLPAEQPG
jgi:hypothetical protein